MARVLVYTAPGSGHAYPPVATAIALRDRGHEVILRTASDSVNAIERLGLSAAPIDPRIEAIPLEDWKTRTSIGALVSACDTFAKRARYEIPYLQAAIEAERPDLIWVDTNATGAAVVAEASGVPWAHYMPHPHPGRPEAFPFLAPALPLRRVSSRALEDRLTLCSNTRPPARLRSTRDRGSTQRRVGGDSPKARFGARPTGGGTPGRRAR